MTTRRLLELADQYLAEYLDKIERALEPLTDADLWWRPDEGSNAIGNLLVHLAGNLTQWVLGGLGAEAVTRRRGAEFAARESAGKAELLAQLATVVDRCRERIRTLDAAALDPPRTIQGYAVDGHAALFHAVEHMSYHTGQIVWIAKARRPADAAPLEFYPQHREP